ncbi:hypothetical protein [Maricaulis sp.]|uniref:tetratricopeptide repeat protein n=1 Tax=Maricaulis sp. TaxID=1486257 RepID=UPI00261005B9|nr:hypothetical protein [Maricaulis sp.]
MSWWGVYPDGASRVDEAYFDELRFIRDALEKGNSGAAERAERNAHAVEKAVGRLQELGAATENASRRVAGELREMTGYMHAALGELRAIGDQLSTLIHAVDRGFSEISAHLDRVSDQLAELIKILRSPEETRAIEQMRAGLQLFRGGNDYMLDARQKFEAAIEHHDLLPIPWLYLGKIAFYIDGDAASAADLLGKAVKYGRLDPENAAHTADALLDLAAVAFVDKDKIAAARHAREAAELMPNDAGVYIQAAHVLLMAEHEEEALNLIIRAFFHDPKTVVILAQDWTAPLAPALKKWLRGQHEGEFEELRDMQEDFAAIRAEANAKGHRLSAWSRFGDLTKTFEIMQRGFLDLRERRVRWEKSMSELARHVREEIDSTIKSHQLKVSNHSSEAFGNISKTLLGILIMLSIVFFIYTPLIDPITHGTAFPFWPTAILIAFAIVIFIMFLAKSENPFVSFIATSFILFIPLALTSYLVVDAGIPARVAMWGGPGMIGFIILVGIARGMANAGELNGLKRAVRNMRNDLDPLAARLGQYT